MHTVSRFFCLLFLLLSASTAWATTVLIGDPPAPPTPVTVNPIYDANLPFVVTFGSCAGLAGYTADAGCFPFYNYTSSAWTSIQLSVLTEPANIGTFSCASDTYMDLDCTNPQLLTFSGGSIPNNTLTTYVIAESDLPPGELSFEAHVNVPITTPEPPGIVLLGTGLLCAGTLLWVRRRAHA